MTPNANPQTNTQTATTVAPANMRRAPVRRTPEQKLAYHKMQLEKAAEELRQEKDEARNTAIKILGTAALRRDNLIPQLKGVMSPGEIQRLDAALQVLGQRS